MQKNVLHFTQNEVAKDIKNLFALLPPRPCTYSDSLRWHSNDFSLKFWETQDDANLLSLVPSYYLRYEKNSIWMWLGLNQGTLLSLHQSREPPVLELLAEKVERKVVGFSHKGDIAFSQPC